MTSPLFHLPHSHLFFLWSFFLCFPEFLSFFSISRAPDSSFFLFFIFLFSPFSFFLLHSSTTLFFCLCFFADPAMLIHPHCHPHQLALFSFAYPSFCFFLFLFLFFFFFFLSIDLVFFFFFVILCLVSKKMEEMLKILNEVDILAIFVSMS